jgi:hypothetical protein
MPTHPVPARRFGRAALLLALLAALFTAGLLAQSPGQQGAAGDAGTLRGRVVHDGRPVPGVPVALHRVSPDTSGQVAAAVTDPGGEFTFPLEVVEGAAFTVFFTTADFLGVRYFGRPVHPSEPAVNYVVEVFDTTSALPEPVRVARRDAVLIPERQGSWEINEVIRVVNPTRQALVGRDGMPAWSFRIPQNATDFEAGEGDFMPYEITRVDDRVMLIAPLTPGERDLFIRYRLAGGPANSAFPIEEPTDTFNLYVRQPSHLTSVAGLTTTRRIEAEGEEFLQYGGTGFGPGSRIEFRWSRADGAPIDPTLAAIGVTVVLLLVGAWAAARNRTAPPA